MKKKKVIFGMLGIKLDFGFKERRHREWRPTVSIVKGPTDFDRLELWYQPELRDAKRLRKTIEQDILAIAPETKMNFYPVSFTNPWDFEEVYLKLYDFATSYPFDLDHEEYYLHITTGTHVMQVCFFALCEANILPCKLYQTGADASVIEENQKRLSFWKQELKAARTETPKRLVSEPVLLDRSVGIAQIIDLKSEKYKKIASRFVEEKVNAEKLLKSGIETKNKIYNQMISQIEEVAQLSSDPVLLRGQTGAGKSQLAKKIYLIKKNTKNSNALVKGKYVEINCATIRGDAAMSALFGHRKGSFTGALNNRPGLLKEAHQGVLFLDEIGELGLDEQAMLLKALEDKQFRPMGREQLETIDFSLICGTNKDLKSMVSKGLFRDDLLARIDLWDFELPALKDRPEDIEPNIDYELRKISGQLGKVIRFTKEARDCYLKFAVNACWPSNFRDLGGSVRRMMVLSQKNGIIEYEIARAEIERLSRRWQNQVSPVSGFGLTVHPDLENLISDPEICLKMTPLEKSEISLVIGVVRQERSFKAAADKLFTGKVNTTDRLRKKLLRYGINPRDLLSSIVSPE